MICFDDSKLVLNDVELLKLLSHGLSLRFINAIKKITVNQENLDNKLCQRQLLL